MEEGEGGLWWSFLKRRRAMARAILMELGSGVGKVDDGGAIFLERALI